MNQYDNRSTTWIELSQDALINNVHVCKKIVGDGHLFPVIKGNAYGHGMVPIATVLDGQSAVAGLCVFSLSEALLLRASGIAKKILVLGVIDANPLLAVDNGIDMMVGDHVMLDRLNRIASAAGVRFAVHLKIDTGLSRFGFRADSFDQQVPVLLSYTSIDIVGMASHLLEAERDDSEYTQQQLALFAHTVHTWRHLFPVLVYVHIANSAGSMMYDLGYTNLFRIGLSIYGYWPSVHIENMMRDKYPDDRLQPVLSWKARIVAIKNVPTGVPVGYRRGFITSRPTRVGVVPVGYADGYHMELFPGAVVKIGHEYAPLIGRVAMNTILIDLTDMPLVTEGATVCLIGDDERINAQAVASLTSMNNPRYITTTIGNHIPRHLVHDHLVIQHGDIRHVALGT